MGSITPSQAWAILQRHARDEIAPLRLRELCRDNDRVSSLVAVYNSTTETTQTQTDGSTSSRTSSSSDHTIIVDLSRQHMTDATLNHLLNLAASQQLKPFITRIAWGQNNPRRPVQPSIPRNKNAKKNNKNNKQPKVNMPNHLKEFQMAAALQPVHGAGTADTDDPSSMMTSTSMMPSMHLALRVPKDKGYIMLAAADGTNVLTGIHQEWHRIERFAESVRRGQLRGGSGQMLRDIVVVGRGTAVAALQFVYAVLQKDERAVIASRFGLASDQNSNRMRLANLTGGGHPSSNSAHVSGRRILFLTSLDPNAAAALTADLDPATTLVVSIALQGNEETGLVTSALKNWLLKSSLGNNRKTESVLSKHMILITGNDRVATVINKPESVYVLPAHSRCEAFTSFSVATLLPLSVVFGWSLVEDFLAGGHDMDTHFVETNPRHNLPVLLALADVWNDAFLDATARAVIPFTESLAAFPAFVGALESQTCGQSPATEMRHSNSLRNHSPVCSSMVLDGRLDGSLDRSFYQSGKIINSELVIATDSQIQFNAARSIGAHGMEAVQTAQDALMCSFFAHADELAFGVQATQQQQQQHSSPTATTADYSFSSSAVSASPNTAKNHLSGSSDLSRGNRPSLLLMCGKLDAFTCGQLVALTEHRAVVKAHLWGADPFVREGGSSLRRDRTDELKSDLVKLFTSPPNAAAAEEEEEDGDDGEEQHLSFSTKTLLSHYANRMRNERNS